MKFKKEFWLAILMLCAGKSAAFDWIFAPNLTLTQRYTDNLRLLITPTRDNLISTLSPNLDLGYLADDNELRVNLKVNQLFYIGESNLDFAEKIANLTDTFYGERWNASMSARYAEESSFGTQLTENGSGNLLVQVPRFTKSISPTFNYNLTEKNTLQLSGSYMDVTFGSRPFNSGIGFSDYTFDSISTTATHKFTPKLSFNLNSSYSIYNAGTNYSGIIILPNPHLSGTTNTYIGDTSYSQNSKTLSYQLGFNYGYDEQTTIAGSAGIRNSNSHSVFGTEAFVPCGGLLPNKPCPNSFSDSTSTTNGKIYTASINRAFEQGYLLVSYNQQLSPASTGNQQQTEMYNAIANYQITDRWETGLNITYLKSSYIAGFANSATAVVTSNNRIYESISPNIKWKWTPETTLQFSYTYADQQLVLTNQTATSNNVQLQLVYNPQTNRQVK